MVPFLQDCEFVAAGFVCCIVLCWYILHLDEGVAHGMMLDLARRIQHLPFFHPFHKSVHGVFRVPKF